MQQPLPGPGPGTASGASAGAPEADPSEGDPADALAGRGFRFVRAAEMRAALAPSGALGPEAWAGFAASWEGMPLDGHMADGGRYRRRRHATFAALPGGPLTRAPHAPHHQSLEHNRLNGGVERWFEPIPPEVAGGATFRGVLEWCRALFDRLTPGVAWHVEAHQFRIEAGPASPGLPTPEGSHRDGVDWVLVLLAGRTNIAQGVTTVHDPAGALLGSFTLAAPLDAALVDDARVLHGVTPVEPADPALPAHRDVLVVTFRRR